MIRVALQNASFHVRLKKILERHSSSHIALRNYKNLGGFFVLCRAAIMSPFFRILSRVFLAEGAGAERKDRSKVAGRAYCVAGLSPVSWRGSLWKNRPLRRFDELSSYIWSKCVIQLRNKNISFVKITSFNLVYLK